MTPFTNNNDIYSTLHCREYIIDKYIKPHPNCNVILANLGEFFLFLADLTSPIEQNELSWTDFLDIDIINDFQKDIINYYENNSPSRKHLDNSDLLAKKYIPIGYCLLSKMPCKSMLFENDNNISTYHSID